MNPAVSGNIRLLLQTVNLCDELPPNAETVYWMSLCLQRLSASKVNSGGKRLLLRFCDISLDFWRRQPPRAVWLSVANVTLCRNTSFLTSVTPLQEAAVQQVASRRSSEQIQHGVSMDRHSHIKSNTADSLCTHMHINHRMFLLEWLQKRQKKQKYETQTGNKLEVRS